MLSVMFVVIIFAVYLTLARHNNTFNMHGVCFVGYIRLVHWLINCCYLLTTVTVTNQALIFEYVVYVLKYRIWYVDKCATFWATLYIAIQSFTLVILCGGIIWQWHACIVLYWHILQAGGYPCSVSIEDHEDVGDGGETVVLSIQLNSASFMDDFFQQVVFIVYLCT